MFNEWNPEMVALTSAKWLSKIDFISFSDRFERERLISKIDIKPVSLSEEEIENLIEFLNSLTGKSMNNRPLGIPKTVPSGLKVDK